MRTPRPGGGGDLMWAGTFPAAAQGRLSQGVVLCQCLSQFLSHV